MSVNRDFFILGEPIDTRFGKVRFLSYLEYLMNIQDLQLISMNPLHVYYRLKEDVDKLPIDPMEKREMVASFKDLKEKRLFQFIHENSQFRAAYMKMFKMVTNDIEAIDYIFDNEEVFIEFRSLFMEMNLLQEEEVSENEEIQKFLNMSKNTKKGSGSFSDLITSVVVGSPSVDYEKIKKMTVLQVHATFYRIAAMKNYDLTVTLVPHAPDVKVEDWSRHINLFEKEKSSMTIDEFKKQYGGLFD